MMRAQAMLSLPDAAVYPKAGMCGGWMVAEIGSRFGHYCGRGGEMEFSSGSVI